VGDHARFGIDNDPNRLAADPVTTLDQGV